MTSYDEQVAALVVDERQRQNEKWGEQNHPDGTSSGLSPLRFIAAHLLNHDLEGDARLHIASGADIAAAAQRSTDHAASMGAVTWTDIFLEEVFESTGETDELKLVTELVQTAAVSQQWAAAILRRLDGRTEALG